MKWHQPPCGIFSARKDEQNNAEKTGMQSLKHKKNCRQKVKIGICCYPILHK